MKERDVNFAFMVAPLLRQTLRDEGTNMDEWDVNIDKIVEHADAIRKLNPSNKFKFMMFLHEKDIITPSDQGKKKLEKIINKINQIKEKKQMTIKEMVKKLTKKQIEIINNSIDMYTEWLIENYGATKNYWKNEIVKYYLYKISNGANLEDKEELESIEDGIVELGLNDALNLRITIFILNNNK